MRTRVTAILVAQQGGEWLDQTIAGIAAQTRAPEMIIAVDNGGGERVTEQLVESGAERVVGLTSRLAFGQAVERAVQASVALHAAEPGADELVEDWIWLLAEDSCPEPEALARIVSAVERSPSVVVAGPKLVDWDRPDRIIELGQSLTRYGSRWTLRRQELDQQQYDHLQDVLGVGPVGMLVRRDVWQQLGGFDPGLPVYDDGLDFCVRARLAGHRVEVAPASRVRFSRSGVAGPRIDRRRSVLRTAHRQARSSQLHRRIAYAPPVIAFFEWLWLPVYAVLRVFWALIREQPGNMVGEFAAAFSVFFRPHAIIASRKRIRAQSTAGWAAIRSLRVDPKTVRTARMIDREVILAQSGRQRRELHFISSGGLAVLVASIVAAVALTWWAFARTSLTGGGLAPLSPLKELWWNTRTLDGVPADPFTWVLALLGTVTFWNPSHAIVLLLVAAIPLTALGGWIWAAQLTESKAGRALVGIGFALSPVLLDSLSGGRLATLILTIVLPWLMLAASRCRESWSWAGAASLLAAVALAAAPVLIPAAIVMLVVGLCSRPRGAARVLTTALAPLVLFVPKLIWCIVHERPLGIFADPGITTVFEPGSTWHMLLGFPEFGLEGWAGIFQGMGIGGLPVSVLVGVLMLPVALLALLGLFTGRVTVTIMLSLFGGLGMLTALGSAQVQLAAAGNQGIPLWTGSGLAVYWLAVLSLAAVGAGTLRRAAAPVVAIAMATAIVAILPVGAQLLLNQTPLAPGSTQMPALVQAAGETNPGLRTLVLTAQAPHEVRVQTVTGPGLRLDQIRTAAQTPVETEEDRSLAALVGGLASIGGADMADELREQRVGYVLLSPDGDEAERAALQRVFDQHSSLTSAGVTQQGLLWRVSDPAAAGDDEGDVGTHLGGTSLSGSTIWVIQLVVLLALLLLALPTGEVVERPARRKRPSRRAKKAAVAALGTQGALAPAEADPRPADPTSAEADPADTDLADPADADPGPARANSDHADAGPTPADADPGPAEGANTPVILRERSESQDLPPSQEDAAEPDGADDGPDPRSDPRAEGGER